MIIIRVHNHPQKTRGCSQIATVSPQQELSLRSHVESSIMATAHPNEARRSPIHQSVWNS